MRRATLLLSVLVTALACSGRQRIATETALANVLIPPQQEQQLGLQVKQQLEQEQHVKYVDDPVVTAYVKEVTDRILPFAKKDRPDVTWTVKVIDDPKTVNAFATPGGYLYVYSGLLLAAANTAEVAGVLGHESGHVVARHSARQMVNQMGIETLASIALGKNPGAASQLAAGLAGKTALLAYSRADELEADEYGARYANDAGYDPHGIATFFQKLLQQEGKQPGWAAFLSTHPATPERIQKVDAYIQQHGLNATGGKSGAELAQVKARIRALPPPQQPSQPAPSQPQQAPGTAQPKP